MSARRRRRVASPPAACALEDFVGEGKYFERPDNIKGVAWLKRHDGNPPNHGSHGIPISSWPQDNERALSAIPRRLYGGLDCDIGWMSSASRAVERAWLPVPPLANDGALERGAFVQKPITPDTLSRMVREVLDRSSGNATTGSRVRD